MSEKAPRTGEFSDGKLWFTRKVNVVTIGLTSSAIDELGEVEGITLPDEGEDFVKGDSVGAVEGNHGTVEIIMPATGAIQEVNSTATTEPQLVSGDPLEEGWLIKIEIEDSSELREFAAPQE
jgi:glycine cleavage system H protein